MFISSNWVLTQLAVKRAERFIQQQHLGALGERASQRDALALTAGKLVRTTFGELFQLGQPQHFGHARIDFRGRQLVLLQTEGNVLLDAHVRKQRVGLEHHVGGTLEGRNSRQVLAIQKNLPGSRRLETRQHAHQGGLATARATKQREKLALVDFQGQVFDRGEITELLCDIPEFDKRCLVRIVPRAVGPTHRSNRFLRQNNLPPLRDLPKTKSPDPWKGPGGVRVRLLAALDRGPGAGHDPVHLRRIGVTV